MNYSEPSANFRAKYAHYSPELQRLAWDFAGLLLDIYNRSPEAMELSEAEEETREQAGGKPKGKRTLQRS